MLGFISPIKSRVSLSSRPIPPFYNKGKESGLTKQRLSYLFLRRCKLRVSSPFLRMGENGSSKGGRREAQRRHDSVSTPAVTGNR